MNYAKLPLGEKLRLIRKEKGLSLENMAHATKSSVTVLSRIERGQIECGEEMLARIRKFLDIERAPLLEHELETFRSRLLVMYDHSLAKRDTEARNMQNEFTPILDLPFELDLIMLYRVIEARMLCMVGNFDDAEANLAKAEECIEELCEETRHIFHYTKGSFHAASVGEERYALKHYLAAIDLCNEKIKTPAPLLMYAGLMYFTLCKPYQAIRYFEQAKDEYRGDRTIVWAPQMDINLASCFIETGELDKAKDLLDTALAHSRSVNDDIHIGITIGLLGMINEKRGELDEAIKQYQHSLTYFQDVSHTYGYYNRLYGLCNIAICSYKANKRSQSTEAANEGLNIANSEERKEPSFAIIFEACLALLALKDGKPDEYIESVAIPYLVKNLRLYEARTFCDELESYYKKKGSMKKANAIAAISRDIYKEILSSDISEK